MRTFFPEAWRAFASHLPEAERAELGEGYYRRLVDPDPAVHMPAAKAWSAYENACSVLMPGLDRHPLTNGGGFSPLGLARIEAHYFRNDLFLPDNYLLDSLGAVRHLPATIVQGRYDAICPIVTADELARAWPEADYVVVPDAGHSAMEPGIRAALVAATERFKRFR
jgi:proline iminopeptidase